jgi:hypothetical protein
MKEVVHYDKTVQTLESSTDPPPPSEQEIREKVEKEFEKKEQRRRTQLEEEKARAEVARQRAAKARGMNEWPSVFKKLNMKALLKDMFAIIMINFPSRS